MKNRLTWCVGALAVIGGGALLYWSRKKIPANVKAVRPFDIGKYLGKWYEIARLDHRFERGLDKVTAEYTQADDGSVSVLNRGFNVKTKEWEQAEGKAELVGDEAEARLKVSFFGPFYAGYNVIAIDPEYRYALVAGENLKYLWILSRDTAVPKEIKARYLAQAEVVGYDISQLIWVTHD